MTPCAVCGWNRMPLPTACSRMLPEWERDCGLEGQIRSERGRQRGNMDAMARYAVDREARQAAAQEVRALNPPRVLRNCWGRFVSPWGGRATLRQAIDAEARNHITERIPPCATNSSPSSRLSEAATSEARSCPSRSIFTATTENLRSTS